MVKDVAQGGVLRSQGIMDLRPMEKMFGGPWFHLVQRARYIILAVFLAVWVVGLAFTIQVRLKAVPFPQYIYRHASRSSPFDVHVLASL